MPSNPRVPLTFSFSYSPAMFLHIKPSFSTFDQSNNISGCTLCVFWSHPLTRRYILAQVITLYSGTSVNRQHTFSGAWFFCDFLPRPAFSSVLQLAVPLTLMLTITPSIYLGRAPPFFLPHLPDLHLANQKNLLQQHLLLSFNFPFSLLILIVTGLLYVLWLWCSCSV